MTGLKSLRTASFILSSPKCETSDRRGRWNQIHHCGSSINGHACSFRGSLASYEYGQFKDTLRECGAAVFRVPYVHGVAESVFTRDIAVLAQASDGPIALMGRPHLTERQVEQKPREAALATLGFGVVGKTEAYFQGGDLVTAPARKGAFLGYGFRSSIKAAPELERFLDIEVLPLELADPSLRRLDQVLAVLEDGTVFACRDAFEEKSWDRLLKAPFVRSVVSVSRTSTALFGLNWVEVGNRVILGADVPEVIKRLRALGKSVIVSPLSQYLIAGGSSASIAAPILDLTASTHAQRTAQPAQLEITSALSQAA